jgi:hypothetical protein
VAALRKENYEDATQALKELTKHTEAKAISAFFKNYAYHPMTGNKTIEGKFRASLTQEQRQ